MESLKRAQESIGRMWANLNATQRVILSAAAAAMALLLVWSSVGSTETWVRVAGPEVDMTTRSNIIKKLQERNQKHEIRGTEILVPKQDGDRIVLELAGENAVDNNTVWKFLEQSDIFATRWDKEMRYQIALQSRLEGMVRSIESVKNATVLINRGSTSNQFGFAGPKAGASVKVELQEGKSLTRKNVQAIAGLVARAVSGLDEDQVHIMDTKGTAYRSLKPDAGALIADTFREHERNIEDDIQRKLEKAFAFWPGSSFVVRVQARSSSSETDETKHGRSQVIDVEESKKVKKVGAGQPSIRIKKGEGEDQSTDTAPREEETQNDTREKSVIDKKHTTEHNPAGEIQRITVGVLVPVPMGPELTEAEKELHKLKDIALKAAGPQARSEDVSVQLIPRSRPEPVVAAAGSDSALLWISAHASKIALLALAFAGLVILSLVVRGAMAKDTVEDLQGLATALTGEPAAELAVTGEGDAGRLKQGLQEMVGRNPQTVAASLKSFMSGR
jgi:flagellar M-ring protein FliF